MKELFFAMLTIVALAACKQGNQQVPADITADSAAIAAATDTTVAAEQASQVEDSPAVLSFSVMKQAVEPNQKYDEKAIEDLLASMQLHKVQAERYISDADFGGDSPAISYTWGRDVEFKNWKFQATAPDYFGTHFNFFFDESRTTGHVKTFSVITSDGNWYQQFMADAKEAGLKFNGNLDKAVYQKAGKEYVLKTGEQTYYYVNDFSAEGKYDVEMGYANGIDM